MKFALPSRAACALHPRREAGAAVAGGAGPPHKRAASSTSTPAYARSHLRGSLHPTSWRLARCHAGLQQAGATPPAALSSNARVASSSEQQQLDQHKQQQQSRAHFSILRRLAPRVFTHLDTAHLHAVSAAAFLLMSTYEVLRILFYLAAQGELPAPEAPWALQVAIVASLVMSATGFLLTAKHRKGVQRNGFLGAAVGSVLFTLGALFYSDAFPVDSDLAVMAMHAAMLGMLPMALGFSLVDVLVNGAAILENRNEKHRPLVASAPAVPVGTAAALVPGEVRRQQGATVVDGGNEMLEPLAPPVVTLASMGHPGPESIGERGSSKPLASPGDASSGQARQTPHVTAGAQPSAQFIAGSQAADKGSDAAGGSVASASPSSQGHLHCCPPSAADASFPSAPTDRSAPVLPRLTLSWPLAGVFAYYLPILTPAYVSVTFPLPVIFAGAKAHALMRSLYPNSEQLIFCLVAVGMWAGVTAAFAVTLRDRKLIGRRAEMAMVGLPFAVLVVVATAGLRLSGNGLDLLRLALDPVFMARFILEAWQL